MVSMEELEQNLLQLGKGGWMTPLAGLRPPEPPALAFCWILLKIGSVFEPSPETLVAAI